MTKRRRDLPTDLHTKPVSVSMTASGLELVDSLAQDHGLTRSVIIDALVRAGAKAPDAPFTIFGVLNDDASFIAAWERAGQV